MQQVTFAVVGIPMPQGSKRAFVVNGRAVLSDVRSSALKKWRKAVSEAAAVVAPEVPIDAAVEVRIEFGFARPASVKRTYPSVAPDVDKLARAVLDGLTGVLIRDDSRVVRLVAEKFYRSTPGARVTVGVLVDREEVQS